MNLLHLNWPRLLLGLLLTAPLAMAAGDTSTTPATPTESSSAIVSLLVEARTHFEAEDFDQAAAKLERALRIEPHNPILWHNLAGVRLKQQDWKRAANLAAKSNTWAAPKDKVLRLRNLMIIAWACDGMGDTQCAIEARRRAEKLASQ